MTSFEKGMKNLEEIYGNGGVYVTDGEFVAEFSGFNYCIETLKRRTRKDYLIMNEVVAIFGVDVKRTRAIAALKGIIEVLEITPDEKFNSPAD
jgi:hypothetical protein